MSYTNEEYDEYYVHLKTIWDKITADDLSSVEFMECFDQNFTMCCNSKEELVYDANVNLFTEKSKLYDNHQSF